ncbi:AEC family transporter [Sphingobium phenoxybenzoativorans]|uniref:AEC family transporter n=1 Tax=Sphingobium phenoxybenzoativorans TaxID=1592790 RepID=UPI000871DA27|nr:AEC family transporter [Sphingobium phenoxybenzoativorans]
MLATIITILPVFLIIAAGYGAAKLGVIGDGASRALNRYVIWLALPCLMFEVVATTDWRHLWDPGFVTVSITGSLAVFLLGLVVGRMRGLSLQDMAVDGLNASYSNSAYIGFPLLLLVLGPESRPFVAIAATLTLVVLFASGVILIELARSHGHGIGRALLFALIGVMKNPVLVSPLLGLFWWLGGIPLPHPAESFFTMLGGSASPAALAAIGMFLAERPILESMTNRFSLALTTIKLAIHPAVTAWLAWHVFMLPPRVAVTAIALAALPTGTGPFMIAEFYARDGKVTAGTVMISTMLSVLTLAAILSLLRV